jgi:hypothetical protein
MWRHGDVLIDRCIQLPPGVRPVPHLILARGEATGHAHRVLEQGAAVLYKGDDGDFLEVTADQATIVHDEHQPIALPRGTYHIWFQREYSPQEIRRVVD